MFGLVELDVLEMFVVGLEMCLVKGTVCSRFMLDDEPAMRTLGWGWGWGANSMEERAKI